MRRTRGVVVIFLLLRRTYIFNDAVSTKCIYRESGGEVSFSHGCQVSTIRISSRQTVIRQRNKYGFIELF